jgi:hypothetical protein
LFILNSGRFAFEKFRRPHQGSQTDYKIASKWMASGLFSYSRIEHIDSSDPDSSWLADAMIRNDAWRNLTLIWECQFFSLASNVPLLSASRNFLGMRASYRF